MSNPVNNDRYYYDVAILVFCKAPIPGQVKTRLTSAISTKAAADVHIRLTRHTLAMVSAAKLCSVQLWCSPDTEHPFFRNCIAEFNVSLYQQQGADLGARMHAGLDKALQQYNQVLLLGCDCPSLTAKDLRQAITALKAGYDVVLAPAEDGGYALIGLNQIHSDLFFDMVWGNSDILANTRNRIIRLDLNCLELAEQWDVDTPDDLLRFQAMVKRSSVP